jgi:hypothetical protein
VMVIDEEYLRGRKIYGQVRNFWNFKVLTVFLKIQIQILNMCFEKKNR